MLYLFRFFDLGPLKNVTAAEKYRSKRNEINWGRIERVKETYLFPSQTLFMPSVTLSVHRLLIGNKYLQGVDHCLPYVAL